MPALLAAGVTIIEPNLYDYCDTEDDIPRLIEQLLALKAAYGAAAT